MIKIEQRKGGFKVVGSGGGKKKGGSSRTPVESPDSLHNTSYAAILDVISNGEIVGPLHPDQPLRDVYLDGTPIQNENGSLNFNRVETDYRVGTIDQDHIAGFPASVNVVSVGTEIKTTTPWIQQFSGAELSAVRVSVHVPTLLKTIDSGDNAGDRVGYKVNYAIDLAIGGGSFENVVNASFDGKTVNGYTRTHRIDLPEGNTWRVRVRRLTPEASSTTIQDAIYVNSYAEVIDGKFRHPMTALIGLKIDAEQFQSIPTRAYHWKGRIIRVPSNYDPETRTYNETWDGSFKSAYSNNPAWVFLDILTNKLYGLGEYINVTTVDRYALYQIAAYCDQMVDNGMGGLEPRFVCNCFIQSAQDAMRVINDLSSVFRGMAYYADGVVIPIADMPSDPVYTYTNANVIDGLFEYSGSDLNTRKTVALVSYNDPDNFYKSKVEVVEDSDGIARYGIRKTEVIAFGCSSRGQAQRVGLYLLYTSRMETGGVAFSVGLDGVIPQPGSIIKVADRNRAGRHIGGRIRSAEIDAIVADRDHPAKVGDNLTVNLPSGKSETRAISAIDGRKITVFPSFSELPASQSVWVIDADDLVTQQARVIAVQEADDITFGVSCVFHHPGKFAAIDSGVRLDPLPVSVVPPRTQTAPSNIQINQFHTFHQGTTRHVAEVSWDAPENAVLYDVQWRRDNGDWIQTPRTGTRLVQIEDIFSGTYTVRVRAINSLDVPSLWTASEATVLDGEAGDPPVLSSLTTKSEVMAIRLDWSYPNTPNIISNVEIRASLNNQFQSSYALTSVAYPSTTYTVYGLGHGVEMWFWARLVDKNGLAGEWLPLSTGAGTYGKSSTDARDILDYLAGQIGSGELAPGLIEEIESDVAAGIIDDVDNKLSDISQTIADLGEDVNQKINSVEVDFDSKINGINKSLVGHLSGDDENASEDVLWYAGDDGSTGSFVGNVTTTSAYNSEDYAIAKQSSVLASRVGENQAYIASVESASASRDEAIAQVVSELSVSVGENSALIASEQLARTTADESLSRSITALTAEVGDNSAKILNEQTARADGDSALASSIDALKADVDDNSAAIVTESEVRASAVHDLDGKIDEDAIKSFGYLTADDEQTDDLFRWYAGDDDQQQSRVGNVSSTSASNEQDYALARQIKVIQVKSGEMSAAISSEQVARISQNEALARDISSISAEVGDNSAKIINEQLARSSADEALAREILSLTSKVGDAEAKLGIEQKTRASEDDALSQQIITLTATVGDNAAAIFAEQTARADADSALAQDIQTLATQIGNAEAVVQQTSEALAELDGSVKANWQVKTQVRADGKVVQAGVGLGASIGADGQVRSEFLVMADTIGFLNTVNGEIHAPFVFDTVNDTAFLNAAIIGDATISFAKIQNDIQSENYIAGETGWKINKNGDVEFSDGQFRGTVYAERIVGDVVNVGIINNHELITMQVNRGQTLYSNIGSFDVLSARFERNLIIPGEIRFDSSGGVGVWVEVLFNNEIVYTIGGGTSYLSDGFYYSFPAIIPISENSDIEVSLRLKGSLSSSAQAQFGFAYYRQQGAVFVYNKS